MLTEQESKIAIGEHKDVPPRRSLFTHITCLNVTCGCGFQSQDIAQGEAHVRLTGHTLHIYGDITAQK